MQFEVVMDNPSSGSCTEIWKLFWWSYAWNLKVLKILHELCFKPGLDWFFIPQMLKNSNSHNWSKNKYIHFKILLSQTYKCLALYLLMWYSSDIINHLFLNLWISRLITPSFSLVSDLCEYFVGMLINNSLVSLWLRNYFDGG